MEYGHKLSLNLLLISEGQAMCHWRVLLLPILLLTIFLTGCWGQPPVSDQLVIGVEAEPERFDPLTMKNPKNFIIAWQIYEGLIGLDDNGRIIPAIAERWETSDNKTWRFYIRKNVSFHDAAMFGPTTRGRRVTAQDVVASYTAFCSPAAYPAFLLMDSIVGCADHNAGESEVVSGVNAIDEFTVEIDLIKSEPFFLNRLTSPWIAIFPREALSPEYRDTWGLDIAVGTGPYRLVSRGDTEIVLERNPDYWDTTQPTAIPKLVFRVIKSDPVRLGELEKGGIDLMALPTTLYPAVLRQDGSVKSDYAEDFNLYNYATFNSHMLGFNLLNVADVHLRRAMSYGLDRKQIARELFYNLADVTGGTVPPGANGYTSITDVAKLYDPQRAREEMKKSKYREEPIELLVHDQMGSEQIGQLFQAQMKPLGIDVQLTKLDFNSVIGRMVKGDAPMFSMYFDYVLSSPEPILINLFSSSKRPVPNFWQFSDPAIDAKLETLRGMETGEAVKTSALIEQRIMEQAPALFLFRLKQVVLYSKRFDDLSVNLHGHYRFAGMRSVAR